MLTHFAFTSRCLRQLCLSHKNLADFPVCIFIARSRRLTPTTIATISQLDPFSTINRWGQLSKTPTNPNLDETEVQTCSSPEERRDDESPESNWTERYLHQTRQYEHDFATTRRRTKKPYTGHLRPINARVAVPRSNISRTPHTSPKNTSSQEAETTGPFLYDEKSLDTVRFRQLAPRSGTLMRKTLGPELVLKAIVPLPLTKVMTNEAHIEASQDPVRMRKRFALKASQDPVRMRKRVAVEASPAHSVTSSRSGTLESPRTRNSTVDVSSTFVEKDLSASDPSRGMTGAVKKGSAVKPSIRFRSVFPVLNLPDLGVRSSIRFKRVFPASNLPNTVESSSLLRKHVPSLPTTNGKIEAHIEKTPDPVPSRKSPAAALPTQGKRGLLKVNQLETPDSSRAGKLAVHASSALVERGLSASGSAKEEPYTLIRKHYAARPPNFFRSVFRGSTPAVMTESSDLIEMHVIHEKSPLPKICATTTDNHVRIVKSKLPLATQFSEPEIQREQSIGEIRPIFHQTRGPKRETSHWKKTHLRACRFPDVDRPRASLDKFSLTWSTRYAVIADRKWSLESSPKVAKLIWQSLVSLNMDSKAIHQAWSKFPAEQQDEVWCDFMLWALQHSPERALKVLEVAISDGIPNIPRYILGNCLDYLVAFYLESLKSVDPVKLDRIVKLTCNFVYNSGFQGGHSSYLDQRILYLVLTCCKNAQAQYLWDLLVRHGIELTSWTLFHFLGKFAKIGDMSRSMEALRRVLQTPVSRTSLDVQYGCVTLLRARFDGEHWYAAQTYVWTQLLQMDIPPSIHTYNAMIHNCLEADDYKTALTMYAKAREDNLTPDTSTYHSLLEGVRQGWDLDVLNLVICDAEADGKLPESDFLICDILSAAIQLEFPKLLQLYGRYYDLAPLSDFGLIEPGQVGLDANRTSRQPWSLAVAIILMAYIKQNLTSNAVIGLYERYCTLGREFHPHAIEMASTDYVSNAFIQAFGQRYETLELCTVVIGAMLHPRPPPVYRFEPLPGVEVAPPTIITWSLLLQAFCRHGQMLAAEKVMTMMGDRGVEPNHMMWSILIYGHAAAQDINSALGAVKRMEAASFPVNNYIVTALGMFRDRNRLLQVLDYAAKADLKV
jgi:pentatricopeptide repeat protein